MKVKSEASLSKFCSSFACQFPNLLTFELNSLLTYWLIWTSHFYDASPPPPTNIKSYHGKPENQLSLYDNFIVLF